MEEPRPDDRLVQLLRAGDEAPFRELVRRHNNAMVRFAETFVPSRSIAEEVAQEAWLGVIKGIDRFEGRSSLSTWIFRIVANIARTQGAYSCSATSKAGRRRRSVTCSNSAR